MTNKEKLIEEVCERTEADVVVVSKCFNILNEKDWSYFCSYMSDYDKPSERVEADEVFEKKLNSYAEELGLHSTDELMKIVKAIETNYVYENRFHNLNDEYEEPIEKEYVVYLMVKDEKYTVTTKAIDCTIAMQKAKCEFSKTNNIDVSDVFVKGYDFERKEKEIE